MPTPTKADYISALSDAVNAAVSNTGTMTDSDKILAFNAVISVNETVDPDKRPTIKQITY